MDDGFADVSHSWIFDTLTTGSGLLSVSSFLVLLARMAVQSRRFRAGTLKSPKQTLSERSVQTLSGSVEFSFKAIESAFEHSRHNIHGICLRSRILVNLSTNHTETHAQHVWLVYKCSESRAFYACLTYVFAINVMTDGWIEYSPSFQTKAKCGYPLVNIQKTMVNHHAINGKTHYFYSHFQ